MGKKNALGKGLGALIVPQPNQRTETVDGEVVQYIELSKLVPSALNPRKHFKQEEIEELGASIREHGIIQPLIVRKKDDTFELIAGERRWRASQYIKLESVPVIVREASDRDVMELALIENLQRQDLNPIEEANGYAQLAKEYELTQEQIAKRVGRARASVANAIRLLELDHQVKSYLEKGQLSVGHAKAILSIRDGSQQQLIADQIIRDKLTVRQAEALAKESGIPLKPSTKRSVRTGLSPDMQKIEDSLRDHFSCPTKIVAKGEKGKIELQYCDADELQRILDLVGLDQSSF